MNSVKFFLVARELYLDKVRNKSAQPSPDIEEIIARISHELSEEFGYTFMSIEGALVMGGLKLPESAQGLYEEMKDILVNQYGVSSAWFFEPSINKKEITPTFFDLLAVQVLIEENIENRLERARWTRRSMEVFRHLKEELGREEPSFSQNLTPRALEAYRKLEEDVILMMNIKRRR